MPCARCWVVNSIAIIGLGLIGGSIAAGLKKRDFKGRIAAFDLDEAALESGRSQGIIDDRLESLSDAASMGLTMLCVPASAVRGVLAELSIGDAVVTDVASVKSDVIDAFREVHGTVPAVFVPGHPIAGSERHGVGAANPDLFEGHRVILTPVEETDVKATAMVEEFWRSLGADVSAMTPEHHDIVLAQTSHLPHLLAYALVDVLSNGGDSLEVFQFAAGGFRDFSRIAASDPMMWRDIFLANQGPVLETLDSYLEELKEVRKLVADGDAEKLEQLFARAKAARDHFGEINEQRE